MIAIRGRSPCCGGGGLVAILVAKGVMVRVEGNRKIKNSISNIDLYSY